MTYRGHCAVLVGLCYLRHKNIRTKEHIEKPNACSNRFDIRLHFLCFASSMLIAYVFFCWYEQKFFVMLPQLLPYCHSWPGPGILWWWFALILVCTVLRMKMRSLVLARDDVSLALCSFSWVHVFWDREHKNYSLMLLLLLPHCHSWPGPGI